MSEKIKVRVSGTVRGSFSATVEMDASTYRGIEQQFELGEDMKAMETLFDLVGPSELLGGCEIDDVDEFEAV